MEEERSFRDIGGGRLALQRRYYSPTCREFCLDRPRLSLRSLSAATCTVWLAAYAIFALCQNSTVLSAAIVLTLVGLLGYLHFVKIDQESLLVIGSLGIQMTASYASGKESTTFIEMGLVKDVVINEAIYMHKVIYYLCILLQDPGDQQGVSQVVPVFQRLTDSTIIIIIPGAEPEVHLAPLDGDIGERIFARRRLALCRRAAP
ncbi:phosphatidylinositol N-acetylglucosaminyltransferase subunit H isoform X1 [Ornithorhynchus anatinus]|uniref:phosphatidylinositol N-acetylglucosaminyltransferase subunit H isoform X1 n=1 Tax=Ornithorhynchus anatinus TaxID=9258 RepID=UPI0019D447A0|nr:phosphatidylinositol N-acetylglucosaminyltransferase subunit H isoform X1 [Ornithorhynchus anatinus]